MRNPVLVGVGLLLALGSVVLLVYRPSRTMNGFPGVPNPASTAEAQRPASTPKLEATASEDVARERGPEPEVAAPATAGKQAGDEKETDEVRGFRTKYDAVSYGDLERKREELSIELAKLSAPAFAESRRRGEYEVVASGSSFTANSTDNSELSQLFVPSKGSEDQRVLKTVLRPEEYPDLYAMRREELWMVAELREREKKLRELSAKDLSSPK